MPNDFTALAAALLVLTATLVLLKRRGRLWRPKRKRNTSNPRRGQSHLYRQHMLVVWERDAGICKLCGGRIDPTLQHPHPYSLSLDHVVPVSRGGSHEPDNLQLAHLECNLKKGDGSVRKRGRR